MITEKRICLDRRSLLSLETHMVSKQSKDDETESVQNVLGVERKFLGWLVGICSTLAVGGTVTIGSILWSLNSSVVSLSTSMTNFQNIMVALQAQVAAQGVDRYTSQDAAKDRAIVDGRLNTISERVTLINRDLKDLSVFDAEVKQFMKSFDKSHP